MAIGDALIERAVAESGLSRARWAPPLTSLVDTCCPD